MIDQHERLDALEHRLEVATRFIQAEIADLKRHRALARFRRTWMIWYRADAPSTVPYRGLARGIYGVRLLPRRRLPPAPFGWRYRREPMYDAVMLMPLWLYWPVVAWDACWLAFPLLKRLGLWQMPGEGQAWSKGHLTAPRWLRALVWCVLHDRDVYPG